MATRKNGKTEVVQSEVVETPVEVAVVETEVIETPEVEESEVEESEQDTGLSSIQWSSIKPELDDLDVDGLKEVIQYCSDRIEGLQKEEVEALEAQMRAIQEKLLAMKGHRSAVSKSVSTASNGKKRSDIPFVNPNNPNEVYTYGKTPDWLVKLMAETGKSVRQLRDEAKGM